MLNIVNTLQKHNKEVGGVKAKMGNSGHYDHVMEKLEVILDHVHVLISFPPSKAPTSAIKALKGHSAFIFLKRHPEIRQSQYWGGHLWSPSYYMSTLGNMSEDVAENYINNQKYNALQKKNRPNGR